MKHRRRIQQDISFNDLRVLRSKFNLLVGQVPFRLREPENKVRTLNILEINRTYNALSSAFDSLRDLTSALRETISLSRVLMISCRASNFETFLTSEIQETHKNNKEVGLLFLEGSKFFKF